MDKYTLRFVFSSVMLFFALLVIFISFFCTSMVLFHNSSNLMMDIKNNKNCTIEKIALIDEFCTDGTRNMKIFINYNTKIHYFYIDCANNNTYYVGNQIPCYYENENSITLDKNIIIESADTNRVHAIILLIASFGFLVACVCCVSIILYICISDFKNKNSMEENNMVNDNTNTELDLTELPRLPEHFAQDIRSIYSPNNIQVPDKLDVLSVGPGTMG